VEARESLVFQIVNFFSQLLDLLLISLSILLSELGRVFMYLRLIDLRFNLIPQVVHFPYQSFVFLLKHAEVLLFVA
jgi:hypothetical protein